MDQVYDSTTTLKLTNLTSISYKFDQMLIDPKSCFLTFPSKQIQSFFILSKNVGHHQVPWLLLFLQNSLSKIILDEHFLMVRVSENAQCIAGVAWKLCLGRNQMAMQR